MKALRLCTDGSGDSKLESLLLPFNTAGPTTTDEDRDRMPDPELAREYGSVRAVRHADGDVESGPGDQARHLIVVVSGTVEATASYMAVELVPGDVLMIDDHGSTGHTLTYHGDARTIEVDVTDNWTPQGVVPPATDDGQRDGQAAATVKRMHVVDGQARFSSFEELFPSSPGSADLSPPLAGMMVSLSPDTFGDWHTEENANLVLVLTGGFELEVGGDGGSIVEFRAGDVCLVKNHEGQGHITRTNGETRFIGLSYSADKEWT